MLKYNQKFAVIDLETTGPNIDKGDKIIQIGAVIFQNHQIIHEYDMLINPGQDIPIGIQHLTGISNSMVEQAPSFESVAMLWFQRLKDCIFIAHNLNFDYQCIQSAFQACGIDFSTKAVDTVVLSKILLYQAPGFNLFELSQLLSYPLSDAHNALSDARATLNLLTHLVKKVTLLSEDQRTTLSQICLLLPYQTEIFFIEPLYFQVEINHAFKEVSEHEFKERCPIISEQLASLSDYILAESEINPRLIIEDTNNFSFRDYTTQIGKSYDFSQSRLIISTSNHVERKRLSNHFHQSLPQKIIIDLKNAQGFLHRKGLEELIHTYHLYNLNQTELIILASNYLWEKNTTSGNFDEINQELNSQHLIEKYCEFQYSDDHYYYQKMLTNIVSADIIIGTHGQIMHYLSRLQDQYEGSKGNLILIDKLTSFYKALRFHHQLTFPLSQLFLELKRVLESSAFEPIELGLLRQIQEVINLTHNLLELLEERFNRQLITPNSRQETITYYIAKNDENNQYFWELIDLWLEKLNLCLTQLKFNHPDHFTFAMEKTLPSLRVLSSKNGFLCVFATANVINSFYFHFELNYQYIRFKAEDLIPYKVSDKLVFFEGDYFNCDKRIGYNRFIELDTYSYLHLPKLVNRTKFSGIIPLEYCMSPASLTDDLELVAQYLESPHIQKQKKIIVVINRVNLGEDLYYLIKNRVELVDNYIVLFQGITGSVNKNYRRFIESDKAILILSRFQISHSLIKYPKMPIMLIFTSLPFSSPELPIIRAIGEHIVKDDSQLFDTVLFPKMISDFREALTRFSEFYIFNELSILDDRVFSKYYSQAFREAMEDLVEFESV